MINNNTEKNTRKSYYDSVKQMGKKEFTFLKMQEYGFWPADLPTPYEIQKNETREDYLKRKELLTEYEKIAVQIANLYQDKEAISRQLSALRKQYDQTWDYDKIRRDVSKKIMQESVERREKRKAERRQEQARRSAQWNKLKSEEIIFIGKGYSGMLGDKQCDVEKLSALGLPIIFDDKTLAKVLEIDYQQLRFLAYHRDVMLTDHYHRYQIAKRSGGMRDIAAPKPLLKGIQKKILQLMLEKITISEHAHGFLKQRSVLSGADFHCKQPQLLINMDLENFFPTITYERVRGMFHAIGYSGYIASLLAMLCTYCERMEVEVKGAIRYVKTSQRILPQGSPASPMITNIICRNLDQRLDTLSQQYQFVYTRYADDMSFSFEQKPDKKQIGTIVHEINGIVKDEGFYINRDKTCYLKQNNRQCITGIVVNNEQLGVPKVWTKRLRAAIYNAHNKKAQGQLDAASLNEIAGMAAWLKNVNANRYQNIIAAAEKLLNECKNSC